MDDPEEGFDEEDREQVGNDIAELKKILETIGKPVKFENEPDLQEASTIEETNRLSASDARQVDEIKLKIADTVYRAMRKKNERVSKTIKTYSLKKFA